jgi:hypothetical protein
MFATRITLPHFSIKMIWRAAIATFGNGTKAGSTSILSEEN